MTEQELGFVVGFFKKNIELFESDNWDEIYKKASGYRLPSGFFLSSRLTLFAEEFGIDPLDYMSYVPKYYMEDNQERQIYIPNGITGIDVSAFEGCTGLTSITIPDSVTIIDTCAFWKCTHLTNVTIGNGVTSISNDAFWGCKSLTDITYQGTKAQWKGIQKEDHWDYDTGDYIVHCTDGDTRKDY